MLELSEAELGQASYSFTQGNAPASGRKRAKSKNSEGGERKRKKNVAGSSSSSSGDMGQQNFGLEQLSAPQGRTPKLMFKKAGRKSQDKGLLLLGGDAGGQKLLSQKPGATEHAGGSGELDGMGHLQGPGPAKQGPATTSNYDDAMQFVKKRRYLHAATSDYGAGALQGPLGAGALQGPLGPEPTLAMLDNSPLELKHDKSGIPDEVLQSLLEHYSHKADGAHHHQHHHHQQQHHQHHLDFDLSDHPHHVDLQPAAPVTPELEEEEGSSGGDKTVVMSEYSKFLLQALERTSHSGPFPSLGPSMGPSGPFPTPFPLLASSSSPTGPLFSEKHVYSTSVLECVYPPAVSSPLPVAPPPSTSSAASSASAASSKPSHYGLLVGSPAPPAFHLGLEPQQLTPSQELTEQLEKQHSPGAPGPKAGGAASTPDGLGYPDLATALDGPKESPYQIENFAQAFGSQFKSGRHTPLGGYGDADPRLRTGVSEFSGYTSLLADVGEPVSAGAKTPTSQSFR